MEEKIFILQENSTRDGLNFNYFCKDKDSLKDLVRETFNERFIGEEIKIKDILIGDIGTIAVYYEVEYEEERIWNNYSYILVPLK